MQPFRVKKKKNLMNAQQQQEVKPIEHANAALPFEDVSLCTGGEVILRKVFKKTAVIPEITVCQNNFGRNLVPF